MAATARRQSDKSGPADAGDQGSVSLDDTGSVTTADSSGPRKTSLFKRLFQNKDQPESTFGAKSSKFQDKVVTLLMEQMVPKDDDPDPEPSGRNGGLQSRPGFSLPLMSQNFRRFNARIGVVFVFQNRMLGLLAWKRPTESISLLAVYSLVCLHPRLIPVVPLVLCVVFVMVPAFLARHSPGSAESELTSPTEYLNSLSGPPLAPATRIKPVSELSREFFRNMGDLQNVMDDFSTAHDLVLNNVAPPLNFSDEAISSILFVFLLGLTFVTFFAAELVPWRAIFLIGGWIAITAGSPHVQAAVRALATTVLSVIHNTPVGPRSDIWDDSSEDEDDDQDGGKRGEDGPAAISSVVNKIKQRFPLATDPTAVLETARRLAHADIDLSAGPEKRQVEIFELQHRPLPAIYAHQTRREDEADPSPPPSPSVSTTVPSSLLSAAIASGVEIPASLKNRNRSHRRNRPKSTIRSRQERPADRSETVDDDQFLSQPYEPYIFSSTPFIPLSPGRIAGEMPGGCSRFEDVDPPAGWVWADKKWILDLDSRGWVEDRCVTNVEVEVEGERWVWDVVTPESAREADTDMIELDEFPNAHDGTNDSRPANPGPIRGEWRRRRWIRFVERATVPMDDAADWSAGVATASSGGVKRTDGRSGVAPKLVPGPGPAGKTGGDGAGLD